MDKSSSVLSHGSNVDSAAANASGVLHELLNSELPSGLLDALPPNVRAKFLHVRALAHLCADMLTYVGDKDIAESEVIKILSVDYPQALEEMYGLIKDRDVASSARVLLIIELYSLDYLRFKPSNGDKVIELIRALIERNQEISDSFCLASRG